MKFDFTSFLGRHGHDAIAYDALGKYPTVPGAPKPGFDAIPMWVADMNFPTAPSITHALMKRVQHPAFGYFLTPASYYQAIIDWHKTRKGVNDLKPKHIGYENGVLGGLVSALEAFSAPGDCVLVHSPTYIGFTGAIEAAGRRIVLSPLKRDEQGVWCMDFEDMAQKIRAHHIHVAVFCSPHNPTGRVWSREEQQQAAQVFAKHQVLVISDEIWSDLTLGAHQHIPFQAVSEDARNRTIALYAPSKTFNLAGLVGSYHVVYNDYLRERLVASAARTHYNNMNVLSLHALLGAYCEEGAVWVDELRDVLTQNVTFAYEHICAQYSGVSLAKPEATYMLFLDCEAWCCNNGCSLDELLRKGWDVGVAWQDGRPFHGRHSIRMNVALPTARVKEAFRRLDEHVFKV